LSISFKSSVFDSGIGNSPEFLAVSTSDEALREIVANVASTISFIFFLYF
jgi:hypothetical protein